MPPAARLPDPSAAAAAARPPAGPFTGVATGGRHITTTSEDGATDPSNHVTSASEESYGGRFSFSFRIVDGVVSGRGAGLYRLARWRLYGTNGDKGPFSCDVPVTTTEYRVRITGRASGGKIHLHMTLAGAREHNDDYDCGAGFAGFATDSTYLVDSLQAVQEHGFTVARARPGPKRLTARSDTSTATGHELVTDAWRFTFTAPAQRRAQGTTSRPSTPSGLRLTQTKAR